MPIIQINLFVCEGCGKHIQTTKNVDMWSDEVATPPDDEWEYITFSPLGQAGTVEKLCCGDCVRRYGPKE